MAKWIVAYNANSMDRATHVQYVEASSAAVAKKIVQQQRKRARILHAQKSRLDKNKK